MSLRSSNILSFDSINILGTPRWNWFNISENIDIQEVRDHPDRTGLSQNKGITLDDVLYLDLPNAIGTWNWYALSIYIDISDIRKNTHLSWDKEALSRNRTLTINDMDFINKHLK